MLQCDHVHRSTFLLSSMCFNRLLQTSVSESLCSSSMLKSSMGPVRQAIESIGQFERIPIRAYTHRAYAHLHFQCSSTLSNLLSALDAKFTLWSSQYERRFLALGLLLREWTQSDAIGAASSPENNKGVYIAMGSITLASIAFITVASISVASIVAIVLAYTLTVIRVQSTFEFQTLKF